MTTKDEHMNNGKGVKVANCPIKQEYCYPSCYFRKGSRCCFKSKRGRQIPGLKRKADNRLNRGQRKHLKKFCPEPYSLGYTSHQAAEQLFPAGWATFYPIQLVSAIDLGTVPYQQPFLIIHNLRRPAHTHLERFSQFSASLAEEH